MKHLFWAKDTQWHELIECAPVTTKEMKVWVVYDSIS